MAPAAGGAPADGDDRPLFGWRGMGSPWEARVAAWARQRLRPSKDREDAWLRWGFGDDLDGTVRRVFSPEACPGQDESVLEDRRLKWAALLRRFQKYGHFSFGNRVTALEGGDACYTEMLAAIRSARSRVWCESYIFDHSRIGETFFHALLFAARRGCDVVLLVDFIGSFSFPMEWVRELQEAGAQVSFFNPVLPSSECVGPVSFRDHRKVMICDAVGFCGGMNIQEEVGEELFGTSRFYDVHAKLEGPCIADLADVFRDSLQENGGHIERGRIDPPPRFDDGVYVQILQSNVRQRRRTLQKVITRAISAADEAIFVTTAYFFPPGFLRRALLQVPARGVSLSLLLSGSSDFYPVPGDLMTQVHFLGSFLKDTRGHQDRVKVHLYSERHMHAKHMSIDSVFSYIGSFNYDLYSARRNLEVGVAVFDRRFAGDLQALHQKRVEEARATTLRDWVYNQPVVQLVCAVTYFTIRLSGRNFFDGLDCFQRKWLVRKAALTYLLEEQASQFVAMSMMWGLD